MNRFENIQALRGIACLLVILAHVQTMETHFGYSTPGLSFFQWFGFAGVDLFFVISGFIIAITNRKNLGRGAAVPGYLFRRFWRIYPLYWVVLATSAALAAGIYGRQILNECSTSDWLHWAALLPEPHNQFVGQAWTLSYELMFYLAFGAILLLPVRFTAAPLFAWGAAAIVAIAAGTSDAALALQPYVLEFLGGCGLAWLAARGIIRGGRVALAAGLIWACVGILVVRRTIAEPYAVAMMSHGLRVLVFGPAALLIVYGALALEGRWRVPRTLLRTGDASYSLYLVHVQAVVLGTIAGYSIPHSTLGHRLWLLGTFLASLAFGFALHYAVERPLLNLQKPNSTLAKRSFRFAPFKWRFTRSGGGSG